MSTQTPTTPKGPKNGRRNPKRVATTPNSYFNTHPNNMTPLTGKSNNSHLTPPASGREMNRAYESSNTLSEGGLKKKKGRPAKKEGDHSQAPPATNGNNRHTTSQSPVKSPMEGAHYAGPTFHASPAPSALPIPSFFSKSVPEDFHKPDDFTEDSQNTDSESSTPTKAKTVPPSQDYKANDTPLDFLFKAAREAKGTRQLNDFEGRALDVSPSPRAAPLAQKNDGLFGAIFPLELEASDTSSPIGPSFATPYKDRMNALRSPNNSRSVEAIPYDKQEKNTKTEALKNLLLNPTPQRAASASPRLPERPNLYTSHSTTALDDSSNTRLSTRQASGPVTPAGSYNGQSSSGNRGVPKANGIVPHQQLTNACDGPHSHRKPCSTLRTEVSPDSPVTPSRHQPAERSHFTAHSVGYRASAGNFGSPTLNHNSSSLTSSTPPAKGVHTKITPRDTKRMEDDLRRILKIDVNDNRGSSLGQSIA